ncbi:Protein of unknown function [Dyella sp. OK004]|uniref:lipase family protein n=1 Tax=Dyella sp. OK004 TaxID=1855292 RepID=UPI0008F22EF9|nr:Mbeg1-like protein [Dyella sp. OK004]SFR91878.1 Protein of unknown function [Dyella sp. OK004]
MTITTKDNSFLAKDAYTEDKNRPLNDLSHPFVIDGHSYIIIDAINNAQTGYQARAYQRIDTKEVVIVERGTDPRANDAVADFKMVRERTNLQWPEAEQFAKRVINNVEKDAAERGYFPQITVTGHSLGGTLAELTAAKYHLKGETFNSYGAVDLAYGLRPDSAQVVNHVLAGDVVSAASRHVGMVKVYATEADIVSLHQSRYLGGDSHPPNPLLAMRLGDHGIGNFAPDPGGSNVSVLTAANEARYQQNQIAIDAYRGDIERERAELGEVLRRTDSRTVGTTLANLPPHIQQQLAELHAAKVDAPLQSAVEHHPMIEGAKQQLDVASAALHATGQTVHGLDERMASGVRQASMYAAPVLPAAPMVGGALAEGAHLHGQAVQAAGQYAAEGMQGAKHVVEQGAQFAGVQVTAAVHAQEARLVAAADVATETYHTARATGKAIHKGMTHAYNTAHHAVSHGIEATEQAASRAYETLSHPSQWFDHTSAPSQNPQASTPAQTHAQDITPPGSTYARNDPRHPENSDHALYNELHRRIPDASENRLLQFTAACHSNKITADNLSIIHLDEANLKLSLHGTGLLTTPALVDLNTPPPQPQQAVQQIQQFDQQQAQMMEQIQAQNAQVNQQGTMR